MKIKLKHLNPKNGKHQKKMKLVTYKISHLEQIIILVAIKGSTDPTSMRHIERQGSLNLFKCYFCQY
jgi:hypothetical protein